MDTCLFYQLLIAVIAILKIEEIACTGVCGDKIADVVFIMDSSGSIKNYDFTRQLDFINGVVDLLDVSPNKTRVGLVSFSNWAFLQFHLNTYEAKPEIVNAIQSVSHNKGDTNTAAAISYARTTMFSSKHGGREGVPNIAIVLTDGRSNRPRRTAREAVLAHKAGVHLFAIGIGSEVDTKELRNIASRPRKQFLFTVDDFSALKSIKELLALETCKVTPRTENEMKTDTFVVDQACGDAGQADVVFATPPSASAGNTEKALTFFRALASRLNIAQGRVHVGLVPKNCRAIEQVGAFKDKDSALDVIDNLMQKQGTTKDVVHYMRRTAFRSKSGARKRAKKVAIILVDEGDAISSSAIRECTQMRLTQNVEVFVVGIGKSLKLKHLKALATEPIKQHLHHLNDYSDLPRLVHRLSNAVCPAAAL